MKDIHKNKLLTLCLLISHNSLNRLEKQKKKKNKTNQRQYYKFTKLFSFSFGHRGRHIIPSSPLCPGGTVSLSSLNGKWVEVMYATSRPDHRQSLWDLFCSFPPTTQQEEKDFEVVKCTMERAWIPGGPLGTAAPEISWSGTLALDFTWARMLYYCINYCDIGGWGCLLQVNME